MNSIEHMERRERRALIALALVAVVTAVLVPILNPRLLRFWPFTIGEFVQLVTPIFLVALFIERVLEVFVTSWRGKESRNREAAAKQAKKAGEDSEDAQKTAKEALDYRSGTQRISFLIGTVIGIIIAALGVRVLGLFVDPAVFAAIPSWQQNAFIVADVLLTGALLGGGADALHQLVLVFTNFMESTAKIAKSRGDQAE